MRFIAHNLLHIQMRKVNTQSISLKLCMIKKMCSHVDNLNVSPIKELLISHEIVQVIQILPVIRQG